jgi:hypothetical protein
VLAPAAVAGLGDGVDDERFARAVAAIDAANADDPATIVVGGEEHPKERTHSAMASAWLRRLRPDAGEALLLAAHGHHVRRWEIPRAAEPEGRAGYLRWKRRLQQHHAEVLGAVLAGVGYPPETVERVQQLVRKERLRSDPDVQALEDALSLVFLETQLEDLADRLDEDHMVDVVAKTLRKMTDAGRAAALGFDFGEREARIVARAVATA